MLVRMKTSFTGSRNGESWPPVGGTIDVPDHEAADLIRNDYAEPADSAAVTQGSGPVVEDDDAGALVSETAPERPKGRGR